MSTKGKSKVRKHRIIITITALVVIIAIAAIALRPKESAYKSVKAKTGDISTYYTFSGNVEAKNRQTVLSEKVMQISDINVKEGDLVEEGDVLFSTTTNDEIKAKIDGEVSKINIEENAQVMAGISIMEIVDYNHLQINVKVDEYDLSALKKGKKATVYISALDKEMKGTIKSISKEGQVVNGVTYFTATVELEKDDKVKVGMSAEVKLLNASAKKVVTLPMSVIQFNADNQPFVYLKNDKGNMVTTNITTGMNDGTTVEVKSGITSSDTIYYMDKSTANSTRMGFGSGNRGE